MTIPTPLPTPEALIRSFQDARDAYDDLLMGSDLPADTPLDRQHITDDWIAAHDDAVHDAARKVNNAVNRMRAFVSMYPAELGPVLHAFDLDTF